MRTSQTVGLAIKPFICNLPKQMEILYFVVVLYLF